MNTTATAPTQPQPARRARRAVRRAAQRGITLLEIMIVLVIIGLVMGLLVGPRVMRMFGQSKERLAKITVDKYANDAFTEWHATHKGCPGSLDELASLVDQKKATDPWDQPLVMMCGDAAPAGTHGFAVLSIGEDGKQGTPDDVKSWDEN